MTVEREYCQAEFVTYPDGFQGILVTGGYDKVTSEFLNIDTLTWEPKASLPYDIRSASSVKYGDGFLVIGGVSLGFGGNLDKVFYYDTVSDSWVEMEMKMDEGRVTFPAFLVSDEYAKCSN